MSFLTSLKRRIHKLKMWPLKREKKCQEGQNVRITDWNGESVSYPSFFDDMGPTTARAIVKRRLDKNIMAEMGIEGPRSLERYQVVRMSEAENSIIHTLLVDKRKRIVIPLCKKAIHFSTCQNE